MPELPEVETIVRSLRNPLHNPDNNLESLSTRPGIVGQVVQSVSIYWARSLATPTIQEIELNLIGLRIDGVDRRGKYLVIHVGRFNLAIHLRMSGDIRVEPVNATPQKHDRMVLRFTDDWQMVFNDPRKFGRIWLVTDLNEVTGNLGVEPFSTTLTSESLYHKFQSTTRRIKPLLLDQSFIAGLGNIYTDEALFLAAIHPATPARQLTLLQSESLLRAIRLVLDEGIQRNGASIDWVYRGGEFQNHFKVYQRTGAPCLVCGTPVERIVLGQRGTHFCPNCQRLEDEQSNN